MKRVLSAILIMASLVCLTAMPAGAAAVVTNGLIAAYDFDGNAGDATVIGATLTRDRFGREDNAYHFDGNDYIQTPVNSNIKPLSFSVWFNPEVVGGERSIVDSDVSGRYGHSLIMGYTNGDHTLDVQYHNGWSDSGETMTAGTWYHAVVNFGSRIQLYINGRLELEFDYTTTSGFDGSTFRFGRHNSGDPQWFRGEIDDVYFYDRVLSEDEVGRLYTAAVPVPASFLLMALGMLGVCGFRRSQA